MGVYDVVRRGLRRTIIEALNGIPFEDVRSLCVRANTMADLAMRGKYRDVKTATMVVGNVRILSRLTEYLGVPRRERSVPRVEVVQWGNTRAVPVAPSEVVVETREECLLAKIAGPSIGARLDIKRECVSCDSAVEELQREKQVLDVVPPNSVEPMQHGASQVAS